LRFGPARWALLGAFTAALGVVYLSTIGEGLWEDGWFVVRFAYNFWHHHTFAWNVADGPCYGMTSQTLQLVGALLYKVAPAHVCLTLKAASFAALVVGLVLLERSTPDGEAILPAAVGLSLSLILEVSQSGLETPFALVAVAVAIAMIVKERRPAKIAAATLALYLTRPDAILIPLVLLAGQRREIRAKSLIAIGLGLAVLLGVFRLYYGTALPLPFYVKTHGLSAQEAYHVALFAPEKLKNSAQAVFFALPFVYLALHERSRTVLLLLLSAIVFGLYHGLATIETMGHLSRFYLPGLVPVLIAAGLAYRSYQARRRWLASGLFYAGWVIAFVLLKRLDHATQVPIVLEPVRDLPTLVAIAVVLFVPARWNAHGALAIGLALLAGAALVYPIRSPAFADDETLLLREIRPRVVFRGLERLRALNPKIVYHTDLGAPGVLFPESKVVDLDGLLNEDITLRHAHFQDLCAVDHPEAIFVPNQTLYPALRAEILSSRCIEDYRGVTPMEGSPLYLRKDLVVEGLPP
jgi:hypothetical protein